MKLQPLTTEVYNRLLEDGYTYFKLRHSYDRRDFGTNSDVTMIEAVKPEQKLQDENYLSHEHVNEMLVKGESSYCVMIL